MAAEHRPVRVTPTNAGPDSKGIVSVFGWDLEGMVAFYLVGGALAGMLVVFATAGKPMSTRVLLALIPVVLAAVWIKIFVHGRPPAYQLDVFETWMRGDCFRLRPQAWSCRRPPRQILTARLAAQEERHG